MPPPKDGDVNEEMQMEVSVTRVGKWEERVVKHWPKEKFMCLVLGLCGRYQSNLIGDCVEIAGLPQGFHCRVTHRILGFLGR